MAFVEGVANSYGDLLTAIETAMLANGWTKSGAVLHADGCFVELAVAGTTVTLKAGSGLSGSNTLLGPAPSVVRIGSAGTIMQMSFPATYHISSHSSPREVYVHVNYGVERWQWLAFGKSAIALLGSGVWCAASFAQTTLGNMQIFPTHGGNNAAGHGSTGLFWGGGLNDADAGGWLDSGVDGSGWKRQGSRVTALDNQRVYIGLMAGALIDRQPSELNGAAILLPAQVWEARDGNTLSLVGDFVNCRVLRIDNYAPGQIISYGADRWRIYPFFRKNTAERNGGSFGGSNAPNAHTGTMGMAVRYDGP